MSDEAGFLMRDSWIALEPVPNLIEAHSKTADESGISKNRSQLIFKGHLIASSRQRN